VWSGTSWLLSGGLCYEGVSGSGGLCNSRVGGVRLMNWKRAGVLACDIVVYIDVQLCSCANLSCMFLSTTYYPVLEHIHVGYLKYVGHMLILVRCF
jgi:hypothetical protein